MGLYLSTGLVLGLALALSPGPLLTLLVSETVRRGSRAGVQIAMVPLLTDLPILVLTLLIFSRFANLKPLLGTASLVGALYLLFLSWENIFSNGDLDTQCASKNPLLRGLTVDCLNPNVYLFWLTVGAPTVLAARQHSWLHPALFLASFFILMVGSLVGVALLLGRAQAFLRGKIYLWSLRLLGAALFVFALLFIRQGLHALGFL